MTQLDMFATATAQREIAAENAWLRTRLDAVKVEFRKLRDERDDLREQVQELQRSPSELRRALGKLEEAFADLHKEYRGAMRDLSAAQQQVRTWKTLVDLAMQTMDRPSSAPALGKDVLTQLLLVAHPDKWSQGQLATALAHELSVVINGLRDRVGGQG